MLHDAFGYGSGNGSLDPSGRPGAKDSGSVSYNSVSIVPPPTIFTVDSVKFLPGSPVSNGSWILRSGSDAFIIEYRINYNISINV